MSIHAKKLAVHSVPKTMHAAALNHPGGPEVLSIHSLPMPELDPSDVLITVHTAGVGGWDADMRDGWSPSGRTRFPLVLGSDGAGTVAAMGSRVRRFRPGDRVYAAGTIRRAAFTPNTSLSRRKPSLTYPSRST